MFEIFAVVEVVVSVVILLGFAFRYVQHSTSAILHSTGELSSMVGFGVPALLCLFPLILFTAEKVPFDLVEAESELIDGITTEFDGFAFSLVYAAEVAAGFLLLKLLVGVSGFVPAILAVLAMLTFVGRVFLARFLMADAVEAVSTIGLAFTTLLFVVFCFSKTTFVSISNREYV